MRNSNLGTKEILDILSYVNVKIADIIFDLTLFNTEKYSFNKFMMLFGNHTDALKFESVLKYADFPNLDTPQQTREEDSAFQYTEITQAVDWLRRRGVREILMLHVPGSLHNPHSDNNVANWVNGSAVEDLNWRKLDLNLVKSEKQNLHLYSSESRSVHKQWLRELVKFRKLEKLYVKNVKGVVGEECAPLVKNKLQKALDSLYRNGSNILEARETKL
ncbi:hypothetical protein V8C35DRAFT_327904 [Trichoderma chlorosporum]